MFMSVGYTCSVDYFSKERTENKNTAILSGLTKHHANSLLRHIHCLFQVSQFYRKIYIYNYYFYSTDKDPRLR